MRMSPPWSGAARHAASVAAGPARRNEAPEAAPELSISLALYLPSLFRRVRREDTARS